MRNILLGTIGLVIVFGISIIGFCQDLTGNLYITIRPDKDAYEIMHNGYVYIDLDVELQNIGNTELEVKHPGGLYHPCPLKFKIEPSVERIEWGVGIQNIIEPARIILKPREVKRITERLIISTKYAGDYKLSARYTMDEANYIASNTILIKVIERKTLEIVIKSDKKLYEQDENILIDGAISNVSEKEVFLHLAPPVFEICSTDSIYRTVYSDNLKLIIANGKINYEKPYFKFIPNEEKYFRPCNLYGSEWYYYTDNLPSPFASNDRLKPGRYTIRLVHFGYKYKGEDITFEVDSNPITIEVVNEE